jgi:hypothetical protein
LYWVGLCESLPQPIKHASPNEKAATAMPGG